jgi:hypothetical protein
MEDAATWAAWYVLHASSGDLAARYHNIGAPRGTDRTNIITLGTRNNYDFSQALARAIDNGTREFNLPNSAVSAHRLSRSDRFDIAVLVGHGGMVTEKFNKLCDYGQLAPGARIFALYCVSLGNDAVRCHTDIRCRDPVPLDGFEPVPLLDERWSLDRYGFYDTATSSECVDAATGVRWCLTSYRHVPEPPATVTPWRLSNNDDYYQYHYASE